MEEISIKIKLLSNFKGLPLPSHATLHSAGVDLYAAIQEDITLLPFKRTLVPTGISIALPLGYEAQIRPRSGLAAKHGISLLNTPGTIDADYRGEISVLMINLSDEDFIITRGMRIAQMVIGSYCKIKWEEKDNLEDTQRGTGGFGSTGVLHNT